MPPGILSHQSEIKAADQLPVDVLALETGLSKQKIKLAMKQGAVWLARQGKPRRLRRVQSRLMPGDRLYLYYNENVLTSEPSPPTLIANEDRYSLWFKPRGLLSQGSKWGDHCTITRWVEQHHTPQRPAFLVHRLDRAANGIMLVAHSKGVTALLADMFEQHQIEKNYRALVEGIYDPENMPSTIDKEIDGRLAISHIKLIDRAPTLNRSLLDIHIETGRKHQIRRHLKHMDLPIVGDRLYGESDSVEDLQLTAYQMAFTCPLTGEHKSYSIDPEHLPKIAR